jgi:uncharacterized protein YukE
LEEREYALKEAQSKMSEMEAIFQEDQDKLDEAVRMLHEKEAEYGAAQEELFAQTDDIKKVRSLAPSLHRRPITATYGNAFEQLGQQIYDLEEEEDERNKRIEQLEGDLQEADREIESKQRLHEQVVAALKEVISE